MNSLGGSGIGGRLGEGEFGEKSKVGKLQRKDEGET